MTLFKFITKSIVFYRKQHFALLLGIAISSAVLTGAFIIGDSIRFSLEKMVNSRLGNTRFVVAGGSRFMDTNLAARLSKSMGVNASPMLMLRGIAIGPESGERVNNTGIIGIDSSFNAISNVPLYVPADDEAVIGENLAKRLNLKTGDEMILRIESLSQIPVNAPFAKESAPTVALRLKIKGLATETQMGRLNLGNDQSEVYNVFVSQAFLGRRLDMAGYSNFILVTDNDKSFTTTAITDSLQTYWSLKDMGISIYQRHQTNEYDLSSSRIFIDTVVSQTIAREGIPHQQVLTYLVNDIGFNNRHIPYSFASGLSGTPTGETLSGNEIILNRWAADDLNAKPGDSVTIWYYQINAMRELSEANGHFVVKKVIETSAAGIDSSLMPKFPGLSEAGNCRDWDAGVPVDFKRIRDKDEQYWDLYRGTPKIILSLNTAGEIWKNPFGNLTKIRLDAAVISPQRLESLLLKKVKPTDLGIQVIDVKQEGASAAANAVDFTELFLGLSFFVIVAGIMLTVLIYTLHFERRSTETALLSGFGFKTATIVRLRFMESALVIIAGSILGALVGILYNYGLIAALNSVWNDIVRTDMLSVHISAASLFYGAMITVIVALIPIFLVTRKKLKHPVARELKRYSTSTGTGSQKAGRSIIYGIVILSLSLLLVLFSIIRNEINNAALYLTSASLVLTGSLVMVKGLLKRKRHTEIAVPGTGRLAFKNLMRNTGRSISVIAMLAIGTFTIILTGSYRKTYYGEELNRKSGTGGYLLWAETTSPVPVNLNSPEGIEKLIVENENDLDNVKFLQFERLEGDEASCLNLNQARRPRMLSVDPAAFDSAGAFSFGTILPVLPREHPWKGLEVSFNDSTFPAFADQNVIQYSLQKKIGDTLIYLNESGKPIYFVLAGALQNSVFQGNILVSNTIFRKQFPSAGGSKTILADAPLSKQKAVTDILSRSLTDYGVEVTPTSERLATFNSVENTYLTVFMALSGLGFIIGTIGLGIVLLRNIFERKQELAVLTSLGYSREKVFKIVFAENLFLLLMGFGIGILAAVLGILPSLLSPSFHVQGAYLVVLISGMILSGVAWIYFPLLSALRKPLISALRSE